MFEDCLMIGAKAAVTNVCSRCSREPCSLEHSCSRSMETASLRTIPPSQSRPTGRGQTQYVQFPQATPSPLHPLRPQLLLHQPLKRLLILLPLLLELRVEKISFPHGRHMVSCRPHKQLVPVHVISPSLQEPSRCTYRTRSHTRLSFPDLVRTASACCL